MFNEKQTLEQVLAKVTKTANRVQDSIPYRTIDGKYDDWSANPEWWTNGFWPGMLWLTWRETQNADLAKWANGVEEKLDAVLDGFYGLHHDVGFMWHISSVAQHALLDNKESHRRGMKAASVLASRFNLKGRFIRAWNPEHWDGDTRGWAIIDCMMNLPLLYWASKQIDDPRFAHIAEAHTETVMRHFLHPDGSSKHIVEFDPQTGAYLKNHIGQSYAVDGAWSRGSAWAVHGLALGARYTGRPDFLASAKHAADYFIANLPEDFVPPCDFKAPLDAPENNKDTSAAACAAGGLLILSKLVSAAEGKAYVEAARNILASLTANYTDWENDEALLQHGCTAYYHVHNGFKDSTLIYGDYFYLEALLMLNGREGLF
jgi:unsaturated chondroitin disaccharide hydrolase